MLEDRLSLMSTTTNKAQVKNLRREEHYKGSSIGIEIPTEPMKVLFVNSEEILITVRIITVVRSISGASSTVRSR
jgi:hypothetical protein